VHRRCEIIACCLITWVVTARIQADEKLPPVVPSNSVWLNLNEPSPTSVNPSLSQPVYMPVDGGSSGAPLTAPVWTHGPPIREFGLGSAPESLPGPQIATPIWSPGAGMSPTAPPAGILDVPGPGGVTVTAPNGSLGAMAAGGGPSGLNHGLSSPFSVERQSESPWEEEVYDRMLDLYPDGNDRQLIERVREAVLQTEVGVDTTDEEWITVSGDGERISWGGRVETDTVSWARDDDFGGRPNDGLEGQPNYVEFRRLRLMASGQGYGIYDYQLEMEFSPELDEDRVGGATADNFGVEIKDAFLGLRDVPLLGYTMIGHFRTPIGLESLNSSRNIPFMERSLPIRLLPGRELGLAAFNAAPELNLTWSYGYFFDELEETERSIIDDNQGSRFVSRATFTPYYDETSSGASLFHTGFGYVYTRPRLRDQEFLLPPRREVRFTGRPEIHQSQSFITTEVLDVQQYQLFNLELAWAHGPFTLQSEGTLAEIDLAGGDALSVWGAYVHGSWFLTGERRPYDRSFATFRRVDPYENFWLVSTPRGARAGLGAWELAARWSHLNFSDVTQQYMHDITLGVNWYWNPHTRLMFNWIHPLVHGSNRWELENTEGDVLAARLQIDF
jgi:phosphate-selective porin OprO/OprP